MKHGSPAFSCKSSQYYTAMVFLHTLMDLSSVVERRHGGDPRCTGPRTNASVGLFSTPKTSLRGIPIKGKDITAEAEGGGYGNWTPGTRTIDRESCHDSSAVSARSVIYILHNEPECAKSWRRVRSVAQTVDTLIAEACTSFRRYTTDKGRRKGFHDKRQTPPVAR